MPREIPVGGVTMDMVPEQYRGTIALSAQQAGVSEQLLRNILQWEHQFVHNPERTTGGPGIRGIAQIGDVTAQRYGINNRDADSSIMGIGQLLRRFSNPAEAIIAYNAGDAAAGRWVRGEIMSGRNAGQPDPNNPGGRNFSALPEQTQRYLEQVLQGIDPSRWGNTFSGGLNESGMPFGWGQGGGPEAIGPETGTATIGGNLNGWDLGEANAGSGWMQYLNPGWQPGQGITGDMWNTQGWGDPVTGGGGVNTGPAGGSGGDIIWQPAGGGTGTWGTPGGLSPEAGWAEINANGNPNNFFYNPTEQNWGTWGGGQGVGHEVEDYNRWYEDVMGGAAPPAYGSAGDYYANSSINSGGPGYGAEYNPLFAGMYYSQIPTQTDLIHQGYVNQAAPMNIPSGATIGGVPLAPGTIAGNTVLGGLIGPGGVPLAAGIYKRGGRAMDEQETRARGGRARSGYRPGRYATGGTIAGLPFASPTNGGSGQTQMSPQQMRAWAERLENIEVPGEVGPAEEARGVGNFPFRNWGLSMGVPRMTGDELQQRVNQAYGDNPRGMTEANNIFQYMQMDPANSDRIWEWLDPMLMPADEVLPPAEELPPPVAEEPAPPPVRQEYTYPTETLPTAAPPAAPSFATSTQPTGGRPHMTIAPIAPLDLSGLYNDESMQWRGGRARRGYAEGGTIAGQPIPDSPAAAQSAPAHAPLSPQLAALIEPYFRLHPEWRDHPEYFDDLNPNSDYFAYMLMNRVGGNSNAQRDDPTGGLAELNNNYNRQVFYPYHIVPFPPPSEAPPPVSEPAPEAPLPEPEPEPVRQEYTYPTETLPTAAPPPTPRFLQQLPSGQYMPDQEDEEGNAYGGRTRRLARGGQIARARLRALTAIKRR